MGERTGSRIFQWVWSYVKVSRVEAGQVAPQNRDQLVISANLRSILFTQSL
ncbi:class II Aldolase and Adducin domain-containing protein [Colletotrichum limetticola]|uniref:Class II Aldolase and Adducin domain-containing protein n=1 Tax=Colletotrichum limetticola TaxID=1209924 RepID=A0ABQ9QEF4_9PEZI|nr:class II Aldolase and Adducin domain-containing protein [Colletotrichum limetticola]